MTFQEWVNEMYGAEVDLNDLSDDERAWFEAVKQYGEEENHEKN